MNTFVPHVEQRWAMNKQEIKNQIQIAIKEIDKLSEKFIWPVIAMAMEDILMNDSMNGGITQDEYLEHCLDVWNYHFFNRKIQKGEE